MKLNRSNSLIKNIYSTHSEDIITIEDKEYLKLFERFNDLISNIEDEELKRRIIYAYIMIEKFLFNSIKTTSKKFYEFAFNDLRNLIINEQKIDN
ncbi:MAG: hypothetical protein Q4G09_00550 [Clostridia bacterium]|nr:hypothetical protein [Clostridia bacterium]